MDDWNEWTFVEDVNEVHNELLSSICVDKKSCQKSTVFQDVTVLPLDIELDIAMTEEKKEGGVLVITKYELVFADQQETEANVKKHLLPHEYDPSKIPVRMIAKIDQNKQYPTIIELWCKDLRNVRFWFQDVNSVLVFINVLQRSAANEFFFI